MARFSMYDDAALQTQQEKIFTELRPPLVEVLPPGMNKDTFKVMCDELRSISGEENLFISRDLMHFMDPFYWDEQTNLPSAAIW